MRALAIVFASMPLLALGCVHEPVLLPGPGAALASDGGARGATAGVKLEVKGDAWKANPKDLGTVLTPVLVTLENESGRPLQVRYSDFDLVGQSGFRYAAVPPFQPMGAISGAADRDRADVVPVVHRAAPPPRSFGHRHFFVAPYQAPYFGDFDVWPYPFAFDPFYWGQYYTVWVQPLPTQDMMNDALPEGVLQQNGAISGFVYFQNVTPRETKVTFVAHLMDAHTGEAMGDVEIPLVTGTQ